MNETTPMDAAEIARRRTVTDLYVRLGRLMRENGELRASLKLRDIEMARLNKTVTERAAEMRGLRDRITRLTNTASTVREWPDYPSDMDTAPDGRKLT